MDVRRHCIIWGLALAAAVCIAAPALADRPARSPMPARVAQPLGIKRADQITIQDNQRRIDVNSINMWVTNFGSFAWDLSSGNPGLVYPKGTTNTAVFASGIWLGAVVGGEVRTVVAEYSQEYGPGTMTGGSADNPATARFREYKVKGWTGDPSDTAHVDRSAEDLAADPVADPLVHNSWSEYVNGAKQDGAPTRMWDINGTMVEGPDVLGDQMLWSVYNDADPTNHTNDAGSSTPLGVEIQQTTFAFNRQGALGNTVFIKYLIINKGANQLDSMFVSLWSDPDLGGAADDLVGCDTTLSLGYVYNANNADQLYGSAPPAVGYDFFLGPINAQGDTLPLTSFNKYINGTDPASTEETYNYMNGLNPDGSDVIDNNGEVTKYFHAGDPVQGTGWLDSNPADRRFMMSAGPFQMAPGDTQVVVAAIIVGQGNDRLSSVSSLKFNDTFAQDAFDRNFILPSPPAQPKVDVTAAHGSVTLSWDAQGRLNYTQPGYAFEGYNVYQGATVAGPWKRIATYDEINSVRVIFDEVFDPTSGQLIPEYPTAFGSDAGIQYTHTITQDAIRGGPLNDATEYYFAVTSYSYGASEKPKVLENAQQVIRVKPQRPAAGTDPGTAQTTVTYSQIDPNKPPATDVVTAEVVNPSLVTGDDYRIVFKPTSMPYPQVNGSDVLATWALVDVTTGDTLLNNQVNRGSGVPNDTGPRRLPGHRRHPLAGDRPVCAGAAGRHLRQQQRRPPPRPHRCQLGRQLLLRRRRLRLVVVGRHADPARRDRRDAGFVHDGRDAVRCHQSVHGLSLSATGAGRRFRAARGTRVPLRRLPLRAVPGVGHRQQRAARRGVDGAHRGGRSRDDSAAGCTARGVRLDLGAGRQRRRRTRVPVPDQDALQRHAETHLRAGRRAGRGADGDPLRRLVRETRRYRRDRRR